MSYQLGRGFHNPLLRRIRRHSSISTLFRSPSFPQSQSISLEQSGPSVLDNIDDSTSTIVQATLGRIGDEIPVYTTGQPTTRIQSSSSARTLQTAPVPSPTTFDTANVRQVNALPQPVLPEQETVIERIPEVITTTQQPNDISPPSSDVTIPVEDSDTTITDTVWRRLQTIFRRHQDQPSAVQQQPAARIPDESTPPLREDFTPVASDLVSPTGLNLPAPAKPLVSQDTVTSETATQAQGSLPSVAQIQRSMQSGSESQTFAGTSPVIYESEGPSRVDGDSIHPVAQAPSSVEDMSTRGQPALRSSPEIGAEMVNLTQAEQVDGESVPPTTKSIDSPPPPATHIQDSSSSIVHGSTRTTFLTDTSSLKYGDLADYGVSALPGEQSDQPTGPITGSRPLSALPQIQRITEPTSPWETITEPEYPETETARFEPVPAETTLSFDAQGFADDDIVDTVDESPLQTAPLQDVWQVERRVSIPPSPNTRQTQRTVPRDVTSTVSNLSTDISRILDNVAVAGVTSSSIEMVAPRGPRPIPLQASQHTRPPTIMREPSGLEQQTSTPAQYQVPQIADEIVDTAIGPLPADLWTLIGEPVPSGPVRPEEQVPPESQQTPFSETGPQARTIQRRTTDEFASLANAKQTRREFPSSATSVNIKSQGVQTADTPAISPASQTSSRIQRVAEQYGGRTQTPVEEQRSTASSNEGLSSQVQDESSPEQGGMDIDDLARKVYAEIKRKLSVEWERLRTKF